MLITEISENDFRKLDLIVYKKEWRIAGHAGPNGSGYTEQTRLLCWIPHKINDLLDEEINYVLDGGYEYGQEELQIPVTIAIHVNNYNQEDREHPMGGGYWDKYMNMYSGETTYYIAWGIKHLYSTRDYYEDHEDYWRVKKKETEVIYRVHLNKREFELKHKTETLQEVSPNIKIVGNYDKINGEWVLRNKTKITKNKGNTIYEPISEDL